MTLKCIHCCRSENQVTLSNNFECIDTVSCEQATALRKAKPDWVDASSGLELRPGEKNHQKIKRFIQALK